MSSYPRCPYCLDDLQPDQETVRCAECRTPHHHPCFKENGGCVAFGCTSMEEVNAGLSIFTKQKFQIHHQPTREVEFGPFVLGFRKLVSIPEKRPRTRCPHPYARLTVENRELREGDLARGRGVIYVPTRTAFKRVDLYLFQGIQRPQEVCRLTLVPKGAHVFERGSHPFYLELRAPPAIPFLDPFQLELSLVTGMFKELRSSPLPLYLLQRRFQRPTAGERIRVRPAVNLQPRPPRPQAEPRPQPAYDPFGQPPVDPLLAGGAQMQPPADPFAPIPGPDPFGQPLPGVDPFANAPAPAQPSVDPFAPENMPAPAQNGWHSIPINAIGNLYDSGAETGRTVRARFCPTPGAPKKRLTLDSPSMPDRDEFTVRIAGGSGLSSLNVAIHYGLIKPGGDDVDAPGFPAMEEVRLLGGGASLSSGDYGQGTGLEFVIKVPPEHVAAFAHVRENSAHNAALRIHFAVDAIDRRGRVMSPVSRAVTFTSPPR